MFYGSPALGAVLKPIADIFIRLIKMIVVPIVFSTLGGRRFRDRRYEARRPSRNKDTLVFRDRDDRSDPVWIARCQSHPTGRGVNLGTLAKGDISKYVATAHATASGHSFVDLLVNVVPTNVIEAVARVICSQSFSSRRFLDLASLHWANAALP